MTNSNNKDLFSVFIKNQNLEYSIIFGVLISILSTSVLDIKVSLISGFSSGLVVFTINRILHGTRYVKNIKAIEEVRFEGDFNLLVMRLYQCGLRLTNKIGEYYIFKTNYRFLPNNEFVVNVEGSHCNLKSKKILISYLNNQIALKRRIEEAEIKDKAAY